MQAVDERTGKPDSAMLEDVVRRIRAVIEPLRVILFGSAARGEMGPHSDLDLLVVVSDGNNTLHVAQKLHGQMRGLAYAKDFVVVQESDLEKFKDNPYLIYHTAIKEGKEIYHAVR